MRAVAIVVITALSTATLVGRQEVFAGPQIAEGVSLFTALQEQAGLKLEPAREVMDVLVIDSAKMPEPD